jgi:hypothetical protein
MLHEDLQNTGRAGFLASRWHRQVPLGLLFWRDMVVFGSAVNLAFAFGGLMALGFKAGLPIALLVFHLPLPYNIFIAGAVWRTADLAAPRAASSARAGAALWLVAMLLV